MENGVTHICNRASKNCVNEGVYLYIQSSERGLLLDEDLRKRVKFCRSITKYKIGQRFWNTEISINNDGEEFQHKQITLNHARAPKTRERSKKGMGVQRKGKKRLAGIPKLWLESDLGKMLYCISIILAQ